MLMTWSKCSRFTLGTVPLLTSSLPRVTEKLGEVIEKTRHDLYNQDIYKFMDKENDNGICQLYAMMPVYAKCLNDTQVSTRARLERLWVDYSDHPRVTEAVDKMFEAEDRFEDFVDEIERVLREREKEFAVKGSALAGQALPKDLPVITASTGTPSTLEECWSGSKYTLFVLLRHFG